MDEVGRDLRHTSYTPVPSMITRKQSRANAHRDSAARILARSFPGQQEEAGDGRAGVMAWLWISDWTL